MREFPYKFLSTVSAGEGRGWVGLARASDKYLIGVSRESPIWHGGILAVRLHLISVETGTESAQQDVSFGYVWRSGHPGELVWHEGSSYVPYVTNTDDFQWVPVNETTVLLSIGAPARFVLPVRVDDAGGWTIGDLFPICLVGMSELFVTIDRAGNGEVVTGRVNDVTLFANGQTPVICAKMDSWYTYTGLVEFNGNEVYGNWEGVGYTVVRLNVAEDLAITATAFKDTLYPAGGNTPALGTPLIPELVGSSLTTGSSRTSSFAASVPAGNLGDQIVVVVIVSGPEAPEDSIAPATCDVGIYNTNGMTEIGARGGGLNGWPPVGYRMSLIEYYNNGLDMMNHFRMQAKAAIWHKAVSESWDPTSISFTTTLPIQGFAAAVFRLSGVDTVSAPEGPDSGGYWSWYALDDYNTPQGQTPPQCWNAQTRVIFPGRHDVQYGIAFTAGIWSNNPVFPAGWETLGSVTLPGAPAGDGWGGPSDSIKLKVAHGTITDGSYAYVNAGYVGHEPRLVGGMTGLIAVTMDGDTGTTYTPAEGLDPIPYGTDNNFALRKLAADSKTGVVIRQGSATAG